MDDLKDAVGRVAEIALMFRRAADVYARYAPDHEKDARATADALDRVLAAAGGWRDIASVRLARLRDGGLTVAVHNDYRLHGQRMTFWLFTAPNGLSFKGEGETDDEALAQVERDFDRASSPNKLATEMATRLCPHEYEGHARFNWIAHASDAFAYALTLLPAPSSEPTS